MTREEAESAFASNDPEQITFALVNAAFHDPDWRWVQDKCLDFTRNNFPEVRRMAATCLGHLARIHRILELNKVAPALKELLKDPERHVRGSAEDAMEDIKIFMNVELKKQI